jgi:hypothetical protein
MLTPAEKICVTREEAAELFSLSPEGFDDWVRRGILCGPIPGTRHGLSPLSENRSHARPVLMPVKSAPRHMTRGG